MLGELALAGAKARGLLLCCNVACGFLRVWVSFVGLLVFFSFFLLGFCRCLFVFSSSSFFIIIFFIRHKDFIKKRKAPQKYIGYIQKEHLTRKRKAGKKIRIAKRQRGKISRGPRIQGIQQRG
jgi:hypothetical protein